MLSTISLLVLFMGFETVSANQLEGIAVLDLTNPTNWKDLSTYYGAVEKRWKMCLNCGVPGLGTAMHLEHVASVESMHPAVIPPEYFLTELAIVDVSAMTELHEKFVLSLEVALQWEVLKRDPQAPTLVLFKFGWHEQPYPAKVRSCVCKIPGLSYELADWISANLSYVVGVATDAPTLESEQTREFSTRTISTLLGKSGVYMIENVNVKRTMPEQGCMAIVSPLKLPDANYVPTRLTAYCPSSSKSHSGHSRVALTINKKTDRKKKNRIYDIELDEILY